jgi:hypothetical protein
VLETVGGVLMLLGLFTGSVAFVLAGQMAVAYFQAHFPRGFWPILNGGELASIYCLRGCSSLAPVRIRSAWPRCSSNGVAAGLNTTPQCIHPDKGS